jgi:cobalt-zinc-cadmium efflux system protein
MNDHHEHQAMTAGGNRALRVGLVLIVGFAIVEAIGGWWSGSLALMGDAGHMFSDAAALAVAVLAGQLALQPPSARHSFGLVRAEVVAALVNGLFMLLVVSGIVYHAIQRLQQPVPVSGGTVMVIAAIGLVLNIVVALKLHHSEQTLNVRAALLHVLGDLLGSVAALVAGLVILLTGWWPIDPLLSLLICVLILISSVRLLREILHVIMQGVPSGIDLPEVEQTMLAVTGVISVHDLHVWTLASGQVVLSAHVVMDEMPHWEETQIKLRQILRQSYGVNDVTLQPEVAAVCI